MPSDDLPGSRLTFAPDAALSMAHDQLAAALVAAMLYPKADPAEVMMVFREVWGALYPAAGRWRSGLLTG